MFYLLKTPKNEADVSVRAEHDRADGCNAGHRKAALSPMVSKFQRLKMHKFEAKASIVVTQCRADDVLAGHPEVGIIADAVQVSAA